MENISTDIQGYFDSLSNFDGEHFSGKAFTALADSVGCCRIEHLIYSSGSLERQNIVYVTQDEHESEYYELSKDLSDDKRGITRFYFKKFFPGLTDDQQKQQFRFFSSSVNLVLSYWYLEHAVEKLKYYNREMGIPNLNYYAKKFNEYIAKGTASSYLCALINIKGSARFNHFFGSNLASSAFSDFAKKLYAFADSNLGEYATHMGGDNFVAVFRKERLEDLKKFLSSININANYNGDSIVYTLSARAGIVMYDDTYPQAMALITDCMQALGTARKSGEDVVIFSGHIASEKVTHKEYTNAIRDALEKKKFLVYFQPMFSTGDEVTVFAAEALARWIHNGEICMPQEFINTATESGLMTKIDFYVLDTVCRKVKEWLDKGFDVVPVTCNFSNLNLINEGLADEIISVIDSHGIDHKYIGVEFNEPNNRHELLQLKKCTKKLKETGVIITIDNFGSGLTTLRLLQEVELDFVKINRNVITSDDERGMIILENMITLADKLGYTVICDGAHEEEDIKRLIQCGCKHFQSFFYEKPLTERFFEKRLKDRIITRRQ